ncbi:unnamed protein product [Withania somnifera]
MGLTSLSLPALYNHLYPPVPDEDLKRFYTIDGRLYDKLINILHRDLAESMKVMAFFQWLERVAKDTSFLIKLYDFPSPLLNKVVEEALICLKCVEDDKFTGNASCEIFLIPTMLKRKFTLRCFHDNRASAIRGVNYFLKMICHRAFDDIPVVQQPNYFTRASLPPTPNVVNIYHQIGTVPIINNPSHHVPTPNVVNIDHQIGTLPIIDNRSHHVPIAGGAIFLESMIPTENKIEQIGSLNRSRMMSIINPIHVLGGALNIEERARAAARMVPMNPTHVSGVGAGGGVVLGLPFVVPNQMAQYMPPYLGGSALNLLPSSIRYNGLKFPHASPSGSEVILPRMLPGIHNYSHGFVDAQAPQVMYKSSAELFNNNLNISNFFKEEKEVPPDDRTVFLTFSKGYPITETEVKDFFTRNFGEDVEAVYMQEVTEEEQALYARLVTRSPAALETIIDGGKAKYNINGKHVWARKYVKKQNAGQTGSQVAPTSH